MSKIRFARGLRAGVLVGLGFAVVSTGASADPIGPDCGTCQGSIYTLEYDPAPLATTATTQTFRITFSVDTQGYTGGGIAIDTVSIKISDALIDGSLFDAPLGTGDWANFVNRGLNANGCSSGGSGFDCARIVLTSDPPAVGGVLTWVFDLEVATDSLFVDPFQASVKVRYVDELRQKVGALVSENITLQQTDVLVPEPTSGALLGLGLVSLDRVRAIRIRGRRTRRA